MDRLRGSARTLPFVVVMVVIAGILLWVLNQLAMGNTERGRQQTEIAALQAGMEEANTRLEALGEQPVPVPDVEPGEPPQIILGEPGPPGATGPQGRTGPPGEVGPRGPLGPRGEPGENGKDSTVPGPAGTDGTNGMNGADGRGYLSTQCTTDGWLIKYTDLTTQSDPGPCRGPQGEQGPQGVHGEQGAQGPRGTARPGTYACPDGELMAGFTIDGEGAVTLSCQAPTPPVIGPPTP